MRQDIELHIEQIVLHGFKHYNAAFIAADERLPVQMKHISRTVRSEYGKIEKTLSHTETGEW